MTFFLSPTNFYQLKRWGRGSGVNTKNKAPTRPHHHHKKRRNFTNEGQLGVFFFFFPLTDLRLTRFNAPVSYSV